MTDSASFGVNDSDGSNRGGLRWLAVAVVAMLLAGSCGGGAVTPDSSDTAGRGTADTGAGGQDEGSDQADSVAAEEVSGFLSRVELPPGLVISDAENQTATVNGVAYIVTQTADGMQLVGIDADGASLTDALIAGATRAEVWDSGTQVVMTGVRDGEMVVLSSGDGEAFAEALIAIPQRYVDADVWQATSLMGDALGVADLGGDLFVVAALGVRWPADIEVVAEHGYTVSREVGDAARFAGIVKQAPQANGDTLYTFEVDGEVVFEALGSEAGVEPGYREAFQQSFDSDVVTYGSWIVSGSTVSQTPTAPFGGGLEGDLRLRGLYPIEDGVAALVVDFSPDDLDVDDEAAVEAPVLVAYRASLVVPVQSGSLDAAMLLYVFGAASREDFKLIGLLLKAVPDQIDVAADVDDDSYTMLTTLGGQLTVFDSDDGTNWEPVTPDGTTLTLHDGSVVTVESSGNGNFILVWPGSDGEEPRLFNADGEVDDDGFLLRIDIKPADPKAWNGELPTLPARSNSEHEPNLVEWLFSLGDPEDLNGDPLFLDVFRANITTGLEDFLVGLDSD